MDVQEQEIGRFVTILDIFSETNGTRTVSFLFPLKNDSLKYRFYFTDKNQIPAGHIMVPMNNQHPIVLIPTQSQIVTLLGILNLIF